MNIHKCQQNIIGNWDLCVGSGPMMLNYLFYRKDKDAFPDVFKSFSFVKKINISGI